ncbi:MAG TPA: gamma-glutamyltransferase, partial [Chloroflexota bacterium]|nr:gamma-glutamyltransferase [Chloroflexota bacterium]
HRTVIGEPLHTTYRDVGVLGQPPVSQGHVLLQQLNIAETAPIADMGLLTAETVHLLIEAKKLAFADRDAHLGDPDRADVPLSWLLSKEYAQARAAMIDMQRATPQPHPGSRARSGTDTTYLAAADAQGNAVSWIQSVFHRFGSGVVAGKTGVVLNNRLAGFTLEPGHANTLEPGKKPAHTLNAYILTRNGQPWVIGGAPGGDYQTQTNLQVITGLVDFGLNIAEAIDAPWWGSDDGNNVLLERRMPFEMVQGLRDRGHLVEMLGGWEGRRTVQLIERLSSGGLLASSDVRNEGHPAVW